MDNSADLRMALMQVARLLQGNEPGEAVEILLPLYERHADNPDIAINLGGAYILQRKWSSAVAVLERSARIHPDNAMIWTNLGAAYLGTLELAGPAQQRRAIHAYERAIEIDPKTANVHYHLGLIYKDQHNYEMAIDYFQQAIDVNPADRDAKLWLNRMRGALAERKESTRNAHSEHTESAQSRNRRREPPD